MTQLPRLLVLIVAATVPSGSSLAQNKNPLEAWGVVTTTPSPALKAQLTGTLPKTGGVVITKVNPASAAAKWGLRAFDILTHVDGKPVTSASTVRDQLQSWKKGKVCRVDLVRQAKRATLSLHAATTKQGQRGWAVAKSQDPTTATRGVIVQNNTSLLNYRCAVVCQRLPMPAPKAVGVSLSVDLQCEYKDGTTSRQRFSGPAASMEKRLKTLSPVLQKELQPLVVRLADQVKSGKKTPPVRFRLQPRLYGEHQALRVELAAPQTIKNEKSWRTYLLFQTFPEKTELHARDLLGVPHFADELKRLPADTRDVIRRTLEGTRPPLGKVRVRNAKD